MLSINGGKASTIIPCDYVVFDLETTGLSSITDRIIEISAVRVRDGKITEEYATLVNPQRAIPRGASAVNHITNDMVEDSPTIDEVFPQFLEFIGDDILVGHNIKSFDIKFLDQVSMQLYGQRIGNDYIDTFHVSKRALPQMRHHRLADLAEHYGIEPDQAHRALCDCRTNQEVYERMKEEQPSEDVPVCPRCGSILVLRNGKFGQFMGCTGYPDCRYTRNL